MDLALDIILEIPSKTREEQLSECTELWLRLEDVFSHAMAITQVCQPNNFKAITGSCQSIVLEYEKLKQQLLSETPDSALNNLFTYTLTDALYRLERKVNIAVLTLAMEVFSNPYAALKKLVMTCGNSLSAKRRSKGDLKDLVEDFDQLFDETMQIGIFAIACYKDKNRQLLFIIIIFLHKKLLTIFSNKKKYLILIYFLVFQAIIKFVIVSQDSNP